MLIRSLTLENFGTYAGTNTFDLSTDPGRPIILVGGTNGAGKTTLLEAVLLCLHGRRALGGSVSLRDYQTHIRSRIHNPPAGTEPPERAHICLSIEHAEGGRVHEYAVVRSWTLGRSPGVREDLKLRRDGSPVDDLPESAWQDFLNGLVPPGVAGLFLFDGERIQALADDDTGERLGEAVRQLLGLDVLGQLRRDLARFVAKNEGSSSQTAATRLTAALSVETDAEAAVQQLKGERDALARRERTLDERAVKHREVFARQGGMLALEREKLEKRYRDAEAKASAAGAEMRMLVTGLLPFAVCPGLARRVRDRIQQEQSQEERDIVSKRIAAQRRRLGRALTTKEDSSVASVVERILLGDDGTEEAPVGERVHDLTSTDQAVLLVQLREVTERVPGLATRHAKALSKADEVRIRSRDLLEKAPPPGDVSEMLVDLQQFESELAALRLEITEVEKALAQALHERKVAVRNVRHARDELRDSEGIDERIGHSVRAAAVLEEFEQRTQRSKLVRIEVEAARFFNRLSRKGSLLSRVQIDPETFRVNLRRWDDVELPKERLSAGEKQLLAISLLWALATVSGRPLPVMIDTPLARLDRAHRDRLLREYLPHVSHQVIVLSTDTEVDAAAAAALEDSVARAFRLEHEPEECRTSVAPGYFFEKPEVAGAR